MRKKTKKNTSLRVYSLARIHPPGGYSAFSENTSLREYSAFSENTSPPGSSLASPEYYPVLL